MKKYLSHRLSLTLLIIFLLVGNILFFLFFITGSDPISRINRAFDVSSEVNRINALCNQTDEDRCLADQFYVLAQNEPLENTLATLEEAKKINPKAQYCHLIAHKISIAEVSKNVTNWLSVLSTVDLNDCSRGFFHGVIEGYAQYQSDFILTEKNIPSVCSQVAEAASQSLPGSNSEEICIHAVGHMLLVQEEAVIDTAIKICDKLPENLQLECYSGVFMENMNRENLIVHEMAERFEWNEQNTLIQEGICQKYFGKAATACWRDLSNMYASISHQNYPRVVEYCQRAPVQSDRDICSLNGISFMSFLMASSGIVDEALTQACNSFKGSEELYYRCISFNIEYLLNASPAYLKHTAYLCNGLAVNERQYCFEYSENKIRSMISSQEIFQLCREINQYIPNVPYCREEV